MMTSTYVCLITLAVSGSLHVALKVVKDAQDFLNKTIGDIGKDISGSLDKFESGWNKFLSTIDGGLSDITGTQIDPPSLNLNASMDALSNLVLPGSLNQGLDKINKSIPTFEQVNNFTNNAIRLPFEEIKKLINESMGTYTFDRSVFPVPQKEAMNFCSDNNGINDFFNNLAKLLITAKKIFIGVLFVAAILVCIPMAWREMKRWRTMQERSQLVRSSAHDPMDVVYIVSRPYTATAGIKAAASCGTTRRQILVRWVVAYATSTPALFVLALGFAGLFSCLCQIILLRTLQKEVPQLTNQVGAFAEKVVTSLNNASEQWAIGTNGAIKQTNDDLNKDLFGWVNTSTVAINDTLNTFVDTMTDVLNTTFGGTVLYDPITEVLNCLITLKIVGVQKGLTWVKDHAHIDMPMLPNDTFSLGAAASIASNNSEKTASFLSAPGDTASDSISEAIVRLTNNLEDAISTEAKISATVLGIWFIILLIAIIRALTLWFGSDQVRGDGGTDDAYARTTAQDANGFVNIPLSNVTPSPPKYQPSIRVTEHYTSRNDDPFRDESDYQGQKLGFAGERNYSDSLHRGDTKTIHSRQSSYGEVLYDPDSKR